MINNKNCKDKISIFGRFSLVASHLVFHHIPDMKKTVQLSHQLLLPGGFIAISDFQKVIFSYIDKIIHFTWSEKIHKIKLGN